MSAPDHRTLAPDEVLLNPDLPPQTRIVYYAILSYSDRDGWAHPKQSTLAARLGMTRATVGYHVRKLAAQGLLQVEKRGKLNYCQVGNGAAPSLEKDHPMIPSASIGSPHDPNGSPTRSPGDPIAPERDHRVSMDRITPSPAERSHIERKTEYVPELDLHKLPGTLGPLRAGGAPGSSEKTISPEFVESLVSEYAAQLGGADAVGRQIDAALYHRDVSKLVNPQQYLRRALQQAAAGVHP